MNEELLDNLKHKKEVYRVWKPWQEASEECRDIIQAASTGIRKSKDQIKLNIIMDLRGNKKVFYKNAS